MIRKSLFSISLALLVMGPGLPAKAKAQEDEMSRANLPDMHSVHVTDFELGCTDCHAIADDPTPADRLTFSVRPMHENCEICHEDIFEEGEFVSFCLTCHIDDSFDLGVFPSGNLSIAVFDHQKHLDPQGRVSANTGQRQDCLFCHPMQSDSATAVFPRHPQCIACHSGSNTVHPSINDDGEGCMGCHALEKIDHSIKNKGSEEMAEGGRLPAWLLARTQEGGTPPVHAPETGSNRGNSWHDVVDFPHGAHVQERTGAGIDCVLCHESILNRSAIGQNSSYPSMNLCADCHQSSDRVGSENLIANCEVCHSEIRAETVPGEHGLMSGIRHDRSFSLSHGTPARNDDAYCSYCHGLNRVAGAACAECHSTMQPDTHLAARFEETTHARLAAMERENCAVCHETDFCVRCHNIPPPESYAAAALRGGIP